MNVGNPQLHEVLNKNRTARLRELFWVPVSFISNVHKPRNYQSRIVEQTRKDMLRGIHQWRWDIAVGWWKTYMILSLMRHIAERRGRILYLAPWNTELKNAIESHTDKYCLWENNFLVFDGENDISWITDPKQKKFYDTLPYHYSTGQMLIFADRYKKIPPDYYDLIVYDESQWFLWNQMSSPKTYFWWASIDMSATPFNNTKHVGSFTPHVYGEVTSEYLIEKHGYPDWRVINYHVDEGVEKEDISEELDFENDIQHARLNINERFLILESIFEEIILSGTRKWLAFMPSVKDAEFFVKHIVPNNPILEWRVDFVAWICSDKHNDTVEARLRNGELKIVLCKDKWNRSLDIIDISDIILNDPTRSLERVTQRIWRGARPSPGKDFLRIHDLISSLFHSEQVGVPAISASSVIRNNTKSKRYTSLSSFPEDISPDFIAALHRRRTMDLIGVTSKELELRKELRDSYFLSDVHFAIQVFSHFASQVFLIHPYQLLRNIEKYKMRTEKLSIAFWTKKVELTFSQYVDIIEFYGTSSAVKNYDYLHTIAMSIDSDELSELDRSIIDTRNATIQSIGRSLEWLSHQPSSGTSPEEPQTFLGNIDNDFISELHMLLQKIGWKIVWKETTYNMTQLLIKKLHLDKRKHTQLFSSQVQIEVNGRIYRFWWDVYSQSKDRSRRYTAMHFLEIYGDDLRKIPSSSNSNQINRGNAAMDFNTYITKRQGKMEFSYERNSVPEEWGVLFRCSVVVIFWKRRIEVTSDKEFLRKSDAKENIASLFLDHIEVWFRMYGEQQDFSLEEKSWTTTFFLRNKITSENHEVLMYAQEFNNYLTQKQGKYNISYKQFKDDTGNTVFWCSMEVILWNKVIMVGSNKKFNNKKASKENIARFFLENIDAYTSQNAENFTFAMSEIDTSKIDSWFSEVIHEDWNEGNQNFFDVEYILENSKLNNINDILNILKVWWIISKIKYSSSPETGVKVSIQILWKSNKTYTSLYYIYTSDEERQKARLLASQELYDMIKRDSRVFNFIKKSVKI